MDDYDIFGIDGGPVQMAGPKSTDLCAIFLGMWHSFDLLTEYKFAKGEAFYNFKTGKTKPRRWRWDYVVYGANIAIEIHGGAHGRKMRHTTGTGFTGDREKMNAAQMLDWCVFELPQGLITPEHIQPIIEYSATRITDDIKTQQEGSNLYDDIIRFQSADEITNNLAMMYEDMVE